MRRRRRRFWIRRAIRKPGALSRQLGVPVEKNIPKRLLQRIQLARIGTTVRNPTKTGKRRIKVTRLLKRRAVLALTLRGLPRRKRKTK